MQIYPFGDLYPNGFENTETSTASNPDAETQESLHQNPKVAELSENKATGKQIFYALALLAACVFFFGTD